jgi:hypothetical protein
MSSSYSVSETENFTITHAKHMAAKVATDLKRMQRLYGKPTDTTIQNYENELSAFLKAGYLDTVTYGFRRDDKWIEPTLRYTAKDLAGSTANDDDPGRIRPGANIEGCNFYSYLTRNGAWDNLTSDEREAFEKDLPFRRIGAPEPVVNGFLSQDKSYSAGGRALDRYVVRNII